VPEIIKCDIKHGLFILQDLGNMHLQDIPSSKNRELLYEQVIEHLIHMQIRGAEGFNTEWCYQTERYDFQVMLKYEAMYFLNEFVVNYLGIKPDISQKARKGDVRHCYANVDKIKTMLGWEPRVEFKDGISEVIAWGEKEKAVDKVDFALEQLEKRGLR